MRVNNAITTLVGEELEGVNAWGGSLAAPNGSVYAIPCWAGRVSKFNPVDKSVTEIGPDFGGGQGKWRQGAINDRGVIYCVPYDSYRGILKIDTNTDTVTELDVNLLPEQGDDNMWASCAAALDGCIYFMPADANRIMKLDSNNNDAMSSVGDNLGDEHYKYSGTVVGIDGCVYGIPNWGSNRIPKYDPINDTTLFIREEADEDLYCSRGTLGRDACIYAVTEDCRVLKIDTANNNNSHCFVGNSVIQSDHCGIGWGDAILGIDGCIYWPPKNSTRTLKYDPHSNQISLVGDNFDCFYMHGALATDGVIYCMPFGAKQVLAIDPLGEFSLETKANMEEHPEEFGFLFQINATDNNRDNDAPPNRTNFDCAVTKFGMQKVLEIVQEHLPPAEEVCGLYPFMLAASYKESPLSVVYVLLRQVPFLINRNSDNSSAIPNVQCGLKRKSSAIL